MNRKYNNISKGKGHKNTNSAIRHSSYVLSQTLFLEPCRIDSQTIESLIERLTGKKIKVLAGNRGYRGKKEMNRTKIVILNVP